MSQPLVKATDVHVGYGPVPVLRGVSLEVQAGELLFLCGPNGAGKTTFLKLMAGLLGASQGRIEVFGADPSQGERRQLARKLSYLPQSYRMSFPFTALEIVLMGRYAHQRGLALESQDDRQAARDAMRACEVDDLRDRRFDQLSGGEARRVLLAQALCQGAELLLLDEPTAALDPAHAISVLSVLRAAVSAGKTAVVVSHDLNLAARFADRIALIDDGALAAQGPSLEVLAKRAASEVFGVELLIGHHDEGTPFVVPR
ncbi:MAG: ABC transporter ATP-binding protein [Deltaproteobacteria bacterium]|nr:ABC transporter ATP-binding protein [Deltaproteobacteria bacterium]